MSHSNERQIRKSLLRCPVGLNQNNNMFHEYECTIAMHASCFKQINDNEIHFVEDIIHSEITSQNKIDICNLSLASSCL